MRRGTILLFEAFSLSAMFFSGCSQIISNDFQMVCIETFFSLKPYNNLRRVGQVPCHAVKPHQLMIPPILPTC